MEEQELPALNYLLRQKTEVRQRQVIRGFKPELQHDYYVALGIAPPPIWEEMGVSRATYYRRRNTLINLAIREEDAVGEGLREAYGKMESGTPMAKLRREAEEGPVNSPYNRARSSIRALTEGQFWLLVNEECNRRGLND